MPRRKKKKVNNQKVADVVRVIKHDEEKVEREKRLALWAGVAFFMFLVIFVWIVNFKNNFKIIDNNTNIQNAAELKEIMGDFSKVIKETRNNFTELQDVIKEGLSYEDTASGQVNGVSEEIKQRIELEKMLFELNDKLKESKE